MPGPMIHLVLELDVAADPIAGTVHAPDGAVTTFHGWMALTQAVEATRRSAQPAPSSESASASGVCARPGVGSRRCSAS